MAPVLESVTELTVSETKSPVAENCEPVKVNVEPKHFIVLFAVMVSGAAVIVPLPVPLAKL